MTTMRMVDAKSLAQKIVFAPLTFQAIRVALNIGLLKIIDDAGKDGITLEVIKQKININHYTLTTLLEVLSVVDIVNEKDNSFYITKVAQCFLYDEMTHINMNFVNDVCYQGAFYLEQSFLKGKPEGLKVFGDWVTVYEGLSQLPQDVQKSWFAFDHFYSDNAFNDVIKIILEKEPKIIFDIGCNTGKFEVALFTKGFKGEIVLLDLLQQLKKAKENLELQGFKNFKTYPIDVLDSQAQLPKNPDVILMSQFLDCFSKEQIVSILKKAYLSMTDKSFLYILEPFWDKQKFEAAKLSLTHTSLYFTAIANGNSKMYKSTEMQECINLAGLKVLKTYDNIGSHEYTLIECGKD